MSFIMIAAGPTSCSRVRTVSIRSLLFASALAALMLLAAGVSLGRWLSAVAVSTPSVPATAAQERTHSTSPFAVEQLGALSGRLFKLESQAGQLIERIGVMQNAGPNHKHEARAKKAEKAGSGGPMLPPRLEHNTQDDFGALETRLAHIEQQLALASDAAALQNLALMHLPSRLPVESAELVSRFGNREDPLTGRRAFHAGMDFAAERGTPIRAAAGGTVTVAGFRHDYGWTVEIAHGNGLTTRYAHASKLLVKTGALVMPGDTIAHVGSSGRSTGPHLHFEVLRNGEATDPRHYLAGL